MEKIVIGVPYEISIEPSVDIGEFECQLVITDGDVKLGVELKLIKKTDNDYSFIVPNRLKNFLEKKTVDYSIFVYKENARFEVDDGKLQFIDESDFKVRVKDNAKMRRTEEPEKDEKKVETKSKVKGKKTKETPPEPTPSPSEKVKETYIDDPVARAQALMEKQLAGAGKEFNELNDNVEEMTKPMAESVPAPAVYPSPTPRGSRPQTQGNLKDILKGIEERNKKRKINEDIRGNLKKN